MVKTAAVKLKAELEKLKKKNRELEEAKAVLADALIQCADAMISHSKTCPTYNAEERSKIEHGLRPILDAGGWPKNGKKKR